MVGLSDLDFTPGLEFQRQVSQRFGSSVSFTPSLSSQEFFLVASFGRCAIRLCPESVALILRSCLGGVSLHYNVRHLLGLMFRFSVNSKDVAFMIARLKSYSCPIFAIFFALWGANGPNWRKKFEIWSDILEK